MSTGLLVFTIFCAISASSRMRVLAPTATSIRELYLASPVVFEAALQKYEQGWQVRGLGQELIGPQFDRLNGQLDRALSCQDEYRQLWINVFDPTHQVKGIAVGQLVIKDGGIRPLGPTDMFRLQTIPGT
jgi:hypothetical protein